MKPTRQMTLDMFVKLEPATIGSAAFMVDLVEADIVHCPPEYTVHEEDVVVHTIDDVYLLDPVTMFIAPDDTVYARVKDLQR